jgi:tetratricopeptide (TPR) repeat protein
MDPNSGETEITLPDDVREALRLYHNAEAHAKVGLFDQAVESALRIESTAPNFRFAFAYQNEALILVVAKCAEAGHLEQALEISQKIAAHYRSGALYWISLGYGKRGNLERALHIAHSIPDPGVRLDVLTILDSNARTNE